MLLWDRSLTLSTVDMGNSAQSAGQNSLVSAQTRVAAWAKVAWAFAYGKPMLEGLPRTWLLPQQYFAQLKANIANSNVYPPLNCDWHTGSGIGASSWFHQSHLHPVLILLLWHRGCLSDITGALFCSPCTLCGRFPVSLPFAFVCCFKRPFCMFLS